MTENVMTENKFKRFLTPAWIWAIAWTLFQLWQVVGGALPAMILRPLHVCFAMGLVFLTRPMLSKDKVPKGQRYVSKWYEYIFVAATILIGIYMTMHAERYMVRMAFVDSLTTMDYIVGIAMVLLLIEASRRAVGMALTVIVVAFIGYAFFGGFLPGIFGHGGQDLSSFLETQVFTTSGIFGSPTYVSVAMVFYFLLFGAFLAATPAGKLFINISTYLTRKSSGGAGKASVVAAALFGMISGSAPANVASIGTIMYPSMKKERFDPLFSGSVLAIEGTAGQLIPPVMGAAAFIMVDMAGYSYARIMGAAIVPSIIFLGALFFLIHLYAKKYNLKSTLLDQDVTQTKRDIFKHLHLFIGIIVLVGAIIYGYSIMRAATVGTLALFLICLLRKDTRLSLFEIFDALATTAKQAIIVAMPCAMAGIIVGVIVSTGLGIRFSSMINTLAQNSLLVALIATMFMALILGLGMPTSAAYIMAATLLCPSMVKLGVPVLVAHFFVFYFANLSMLTPPVALSSFTAAGIVGIDMWKLGLEAFKYSFIIFLIPYTFIYSPELLGFGTLTETVVAAVPTLIGVYALCVALIGFALTKTWKIERILFAVSAILMVVPETFSDIAGLALFAALMVIQFLRRKKQPSEEFPPTPEVSS